MENGSLGNSIEEDIEKKISWKKRINLRNEKNQNKDDKIREVSSTVQSIRSAPPSFITVCFSFTLTMI